MPVRVEHELPEQNAQEPNGAEQRAECESRGELAERDPPPVPELHFLERHRACDERRRLRTGVAAGAHHQRNEEDQHRDLLQLGVEVLQRLCGEHLAHHQHGQPAGALLEHAADGHLHVRLVERLHAAEFLHVLGLLFLDRVDDIVDGNDAEETLAFVDDGHRHEVVLRREPDDFLAVGRRGDGAHLGPRDVGDAGALGRREQLAEREHARNGAGFVGGVDRVHRLAPARPRHGTHPRERALHRVRSRHRDELRRHQTAGAVGLVREQFFGLDALRIGHGIDDFFGVILVDLLEGVRAIVRCHLRDEPGGLLGTHRLEHLGAQFLVQVLENRGGALLCQHREKYRNLAARQTLRDVREICGMHLLGLGGNRARFTLEEVEDVWRKEHGHGPLHAS